MWQFVATINFQSVGQFRPPPLVQIGLTGGFQPKSFTLSLSGDGLLGENGKKSCLYRDRNQTHC